MPRSKTKATWQQPFVRDRVTVQTRLCAAFRVLVSVVNHAPVRRSRQR